MEISVLGPMSGKAAGMSGNHWHSLCFQISSKIEGSLCLPKWGSFFSPSGHPLSMVAPCKLNRKTQRERAGDQGFPLLFHPPPGLFSSYTHMLRPSQRGLCRKAGDSGRDCLLFPLIALSEGTGTLQQVPRWLYTQDDALWQELRAPARKPTDRPQARLNAAGLRETQNLDMGSPLQLGP